MLTFPAQVNDAAPFVPLKMPLSRCRVAPAATRSPAGSGARRRWGRCSGVFANDSTPPTIRAGKGRGLRGRAPGIAASAGWENLPVEITARRPSGIVTPTAGAGPGGARGVPGWSL